MTVMMLAPPSQYDHPYRGHVIEQRLSAAQIARLCPGEACATVIKGVCHIMLPNGEKDRRVIALMRRHEIGHCNGWPASHPNGRMVEIGGHQIRINKSLSITFY